jgi:hypothetical protein
MLYGLRLLRTWKPRGVPAGLAVSRAVVLVMLAWCVFPLAQHMIDPWLLTDTPMVRLLPQLDRARLQAELERTPGQHLVIVHNRLSATGAQDWVYNEPDLHHAKIVWARDMGPAKNQELILYFHNRQIWFVDQDDGIMRLTAYQERTSEQTLAAAKNLMQPGQRN